MKHIVALFVALMAIVVAPAARAEDTATDRMRAHFAHGVKLFDASPPDYPGALAEFVAAYNEKRAWSIKRNIAACLRALKRYPEAIEALEEMLVEGRDQMKPEVKEMAEKAITEMKAMVADVRVTIQPAGAKATLTVGTAAGGNLVVPPEKWGHLYLAPGEYTFSAQAEGYFEATHKRMVASGQRLDIPLTLVQREVMATLNIRATPPEAQIFVDKEPPRVGVWQGEVRAGPHRVEVSARGYKSYVADVNVPLGEVRDLPVSLTALPLPPPPPAPDVPASMLPKKDRVWYGLAGLSLHGGEAKLAAPFEDDSGKKRSFVGVGLALRLGRQLSRYVSVEGLGELGTMNSDDYFPKSQPQVRATVATQHWVLAPSLRFHTPGEVKFIAGVALGLMGQGAQARVGTKDVSGNGVGTMALFEVGLEVELKKLFVQAVIFGDVHDMGKVKDSSGQTLFDDRSAGRGGLRISLGYPF